MTRYIPAVIGERTCCDYYFEFCLPAPGENASICGQDSPATYSKLYTLAGVFSSTVVSSLSVDVTNRRAVGMGYLNQSNNGSVWNTTNSGTGRGIQMLQSGRWTSTVKSSIDLSAKILSNTGVEWDGTNTPVTGQKVGGAPGIASLLLYSGQFTSTLKTSRSVAAVDTTPTGVSWNGTDTPWCGTQASKLYLTAGQFNSGVTNSVAVSATVNGISYAVSGLIWCYAGAPSKAMQNSGQFTSTIKTSLNVSSLTPSVADISL